MSEDKDLQFIELEHIAEAEKEDEPVSLSMSDLLKLDASDVRGHHIHGHRKKKHFSKSKNRRRTLKIFLTAICLLLLLLVIGALFLLSKWSAAKNMSAAMFQDKNELSFDENVTANSLDDSSVDTENIPALPDTYTISYNGKTYAYNDNLVNILFMGIDNKGDTQEDGAITAHQADSLVLATIDVVKKKLSFINIPRDTVTDIQVLDLNNEYVKTIKGPIAIQHSYGDEGAASNEATVSAVSSLLYSTPIYRYAAIDMSAVPIVNDAAGGVTVEILEDMTKWNPAMKKGTTYTLMGKDATIYACRRDVGIDDSAIGRMKRQSQYLKELFAAGKAKTKENILFPVSTFMEISDMIQTNLTTYEITYLARQAIEMDLNEEAIQTLPGEMRHIEEGEYEEYGYPMGYVVDETALKELILSVFYEEVL